MDWKPPAAIYSSMDSASILPQFPERYGSADLKTEYRPDGGRYCHDLCKKPLYRLSLKNCTVHDLFAVLQLYMHILIIIRLDPYKRAQLTKTLASCFTTPRWGISFCISTCTPSRSEQSFDISSYIFCAPEAMQPVPEQTRTRQV